MISLVVPTYNEARNIEQLVERTGAALSATGEAFELIIVDDNSSDGTPGIVQGLQAGRPWLKLLVRENERDLSTAVLAGWRTARGDVLGCMDADLQHPPETLPKLLARMRQSGAQIVVASRHVPGGGVSEWSLARRLVSWTATLMATFVLPGTLGKIRDPMSGFFLLRRSVVDRVGLNPIGYKILLEVLGKGDYVLVEEVPYIFEERASGASKWRAATVWRYLVHLIRLSFETREAVRIGKYALVGISGALVNFLSLRWLVERLGWTVPAAALGGAGLAIINNFAWNERFTFWETHQAEPGGSRVLRRFLAFAVFSAAGVGINVALIILLVLGLGWRLGPAIVTGIGIAALWNFFVNSNVTWQAWWNRKILSQAAADKEKIGRLDSTGARTTNDGLASVPCNLCRATEFKILYSGQPSSVARLPAQSFRCTSSGHGIFTNIVQCSQCGLIYENPREPEEVIEEQYALVEDPAYEREMPGRGRTFANLLDRLEDFAASGRLIDIGCYTGLFLDLARERGWETLGVEPSRWAAERAKEKGLTVLNCSLRQADLPSESFDVVTLWDVIEHLHDPLGALKKIRRILRPGGTLGLSTMNAGSFFAKALGRSWPWFMRMHLYYFTPGTMTQMLKAAGFEVVATEEHRRVVSLRYFIEKAASQVPAIAPLGVWIARPFGRLSVSIDFGDIMNVFAVRPGGTQQIRAEAADLAE